MQPAARRRVLSLCVSNGATDSLFLFQELGSFSLLFSTVDPVGALALAAPFSARVVTSASGSFMMKRFGKARLDRRRRHESMVFQ